MRATTTATRQLLLLLQLVFFILLNGFGFQVLDGRAGIKLALELLWLVELLLLIHGVEFVLVVRLRLLLNKLHAGALVARLKATLFLFLSQSIRNLGFGYLF